MDSKQESPDQYDSTAVQMLVIPEGMMEEAVKAMEELGILRSSTGITGTECHQEGPNNWVCTDRDQALP